MVMKLSQNIDCKVDRLDVKDIYRVRGKNTEKQNTPIVIETGSTLLKTEFLKKAKEFNTRNKTKLCAKHLGFTVQEETPIFLSEHLTPKGSRLYFLARDLAKSNAYKFCWTSYGKIYIRKDEQSPIIIIRSEDQTVLWSLVVYLSLHLPPIEMRVDDLEQPAPREQPPASTQRPEPHKEFLNLGKCFHMPRSECPKEPGTCVRVGAVSVFCCDLNSSTTLMETLSSTITQNTTYLHVLNATIDEVDVSQAVFRRLASMALTDGNIGKITGQFPKHSSMACLNISNNNLTTAKLPSTHRPFAYLFNLTVLDASANNLTEFPLSLVHSNKKISVDLSGNKYLPCKHFQRAMDTNNISLVTFMHYNQTFCALDLQFNWFKDVQIVQIDHLRVQKELNANCRKIKPLDSNCSCMFERLELMGDEVTNLVAVDCSRRGLRDLPLDLPPNTVKLNVSYNNITSLQAVGDDPSYEHLRQLFADHNDITNIVDLEGTKFIDNFRLFSISHNKLKTIHTYVLSNRIGVTGPILSIAGNRIICDCNAEKMIKPWLQENFKNIPDYKGVECRGGLGPVVDLVEARVCHTPRDWTDYIYYIIGLEVLVFVLLIAKVSYDYWVFKTAGYLPWPANKMPRLPCDWLCE